MGMGSEECAIRMVDGVKVSIVGCWDSNGPKGELGFEFYDLFVDGECINLGEPCHRRPQNKTIRAYLEGWKATK